MLDLQLFRDDPERVRASLRKRGRDPAAADDIVRLDREWRETLQQASRLRAQRNKAAASIGQAKKAGGDVATLQLEMKNVGAEIERLEAREKELDATLRAALMRMPSLVHDSVPVGKDDTENVPIRTWGKNNPHAFAAKSHVDLLATLRLGDIDRAAKVAGARFFYLTGAGVQLSYAIQQYALDTLAKRGWTLVDPPYLLRKEAVAGATDLHDFEDVIYRIEGEDLYLIATSEHALGAMHMGEILEEKDLPKRYAGVSPCFRKEAGAHGKDTKGIFRVHQFHKIEQFVFCKADDSWPIHEELIANSEALVQGLEIPYRIVNICTGDLGTVASKKYDLEAWMPVQGAYRELVSCSNCTDYQARRWEIRTRPSTDAPTKFVHTLNSTALAVERTIVALLENHQRADGSLHIPAALRPYLGGRASLGPA